QKPEDCQINNWPFKSETPFIAQNTSSVMAFSDSILLLTGHYWSMMKKRAPVMACINSSGPV
ncbi:MAG: hypothetical protein ABI363_00960, partial [Nitrosospira sp.]